MRREILALMILSVVVIILVLIMLSPGGRGTTVKIGYNQYSVNHAPAMLAFDQGYFPDHTEEVKFSSGKDVAMSLAAGDIDVGYGGISNFFPAVERGAPIKVVAFSTIGGTMIVCNPEAVEVEGTRSERIRSLEGKRIGVHKVGTTTDIVLRLMLNGGGLDPEEDVEILYPIKIPYQAIALMEEKRIDAVTTNPTGAKYCIERGARILLGWKEVYAGGLYPATVVVVREEFITGKPEVAESVVRAHARAIRLLQTDVDGSAGLLAERFEELDVNDIMKQREMNNYRGWIDLKVLDEYVVAMVKSGILERSLTRTEILDNRYVSILR